MHLTAKGRAKLAEMASHPRFGDIYRVEATPMFPADDGRRWMYLRGPDDHRRHTLLVLTSSFAGVLIHMDNLIGFERVEE